jgi:hypothetical protein
MGAVKNDGAGSLSDDEVKASVSYEQRVIGHTTLLY